MARRKYDNNTTEALIDAEMELYREFYEEQKQIDKSPAVMETNGPETRNGTIVNATTVNVRSGPTLDINNVIEILRRGDKVIILDKVGEDFYKVSTSLNRIGYIFSYFVEEE